MDIVEIDDQDADQLLAVIDYVRKKLKEDEETEDEETVYVIPFVKGLIKSLVEDRLGETYELGTVTLENDDEEEGGDLFDEFDFE